MRAPVEHHVCPFFHANDMRCAQRFTLERVSEVFHYCLRDFEHCQVFHQLRIDIDPRSAAQPLARAG